MAGLQMGHPCVGLAALGGHTTPPDARMYRICPRTAPPPRSDTPQTRPHACNCTWRKSSKFHLSHGTMQFCHGMMQFYCPLSYDFASRAPVPQGLRASGLKGLCEVPLPWGSVLGHDVVYRGMQHAPPCIIVHLGLGHARHGQEQHAVGCAMARCSSAMDRSNRPLGVDARAFPQGRQGTPQHDSSTPVWGHTWRHAGGERGP